jgi:uncharacterized protein DUF6295
MCTYRTELLTVQGSAKGTHGWFTLTDASVYVDHPVHAPALHTLNIDLRNPGLGAGARVAMELDAGSARALARAIQAALDGLPVGVLEEPPPSQRA